MTRRWRIPPVACLTAGIALADLNVIVQSTLESGHRPDAARTREPKWTLNVPVGHAATKKHLHEDASLLKQGDTVTLPMGYLVHGPVGTGKTL